MMKRKIIDVHVNMGMDASNRRKRLFPVQQGFKEVLQKMDVFGVVAAVMVPFPSPAGQFDGNIPWYLPENNDLVHAHTFSKRLLPFPAVNPNDARSVERVKSFALRNIKGIKVSHTIPMGFSLDKLVKHPLMRIVRDNKLIVKLHIGTGKEQGAKKVHVTLDYAIRVAEAYPDITFIFCHVGRLHKDMLHVLHLDNVVFDTSGFALWNNWSQFIAKEPLELFRNSTPVTVIERLVQLGFEKKLLFGSDEPYTTYKRQIEIVERASISERVKNNIFCGNAKRLLQVRF
jgi:predicted TIM-barrel fold metal-dependent hydrolase